MELDRLEKRIRALQARKAARAATFERVQGIDPTEHEAAVYHAIHADIAADAHTYYNLPGGRGSCKSSFVSLEIVDGIQKDPTGTGSAVVFRRWGSTLRESVFAQIQWAIDALGVSDLWSCTVSPMRCTYLPTGAQIIFRGLDDNSKIKSIKPAKGFFRWVWFEEFSELPGENFVRSVMQSVGRGGKPVVFRSFNPPVSLNNWANKFIQQPNEEALTLHTDYTQVPPEWLGEVFLNEAQRIQSLNPKVYDHEYLGIPTGSGGEVFTTLEVREIADEELAMQCYRYVGCDFGFASDPAAVVALYYDRSTETIYFADEIYKRGLSNEALAAEIRAHSLDHVGETRKNPITGAETAPEQVIYCDCAEPKSIMDLRTYGLQARPCTKRPGCVNYRIKWLQKRTLVVDPRRTPNIYREFSQYEYDTDKDGNFLPSVPDRDNHTIDSVAYSLDRLIFNKNEGA